MWFCQQQYSSLFIKIKQNQANSRNNKKNSLIIFNEKEMSSMKEHDSLRMTNLVQDFHPVIRRKAITSIRTSYPTFFNQQTVSNMLSMNDSQKLIIEQYSKIHNIIDLVDQHIRRRIQCYQNEVVSVVQKQIQQMRQQTGQVVQQFNAMIQQKNKQNEIWSLNNQLDYFKCQAKKLFQQNKQMKKQNAQFKKRIKLYQAQLQNKEIIMQKLLYKYQKEKYYKEKLKVRLNTQIGQIKKQAYLKRRQKPSLVNQQDSFLVPQIRLSLNKRSTQQSKLYIQKSNSKVNKGYSKNINNSEQNQKSQQNNSILNIEYEDDQCSSSSLSFNAKSINITTPKVQVKNQSSQANIYLSQHSYKQLFQKKNKCINPLTKQYAAQTQLQQELYGYNQQTNKKKQYSNQTNNTSPIKKKQIDFAKNGFQVKQIKQNRSTNLNFKQTPNDCQNSRQYQSSFNRYKLMTEPDFNKDKTQSVRSISQMEKDFNRTKQIKIKNNFNRKMACKFQNNKIIQKAYSKQKFNNLQSK